MPSLGADMEDGTLVQWLKRPGDSLKRGDIAAVVETQKGAIEIEVFHDGVLQEILALPGTKLPVGALLAIIRAPGEVMAEKPPEPAVPPTAVPAAPIAAALMPSPPSPAGYRVTPAARREVESRRIDVTSLHPGPDGIIGLRELAGAPTARPKPGGFEDMRKAIGAAMARSKREIPHYYVTSLLDLSPTMAWLSQENAERSAETRLLPLVPILKACAVGLTKVSELNGHYQDGRFTPTTQVKMGVGIAMRGGGLIAPAIDRMESLSLADLMTRLADLTARVRGGRLRSSDLIDATVTLSSLGEGSADELLPIIYPPQVAIIGVGRIAERPLAVNGTMSLRMTASFAVAGDHRVSDGRSAARFLNLVQSFLERPEAL